MDKPGDGIVTLAQAIIEGLLTHNKALLTSLGLGLIWGYYIYRKKRALGHLMGSTFFNPVGPAYDFIIVGGGSAACILANRLSEDPSCRVLLISEGRMILDHVSLRTPLGWGSPWFSEMDLNLKTTPQEKLGDRQIELHRPRLMGGCGASDTLLYLRGDKEDFDHWATDLNLKGWSYEDLLPYFKKSEKFHGTKSKFRGTSGELEVRPTIPTSFGNAFLDGCHAVGIPRRVGDDCNSENPLSGAYITQNTITRKNERSFGPNSFLRPIHEERGNLTVKPDCLARKLIIKDDEVVGVEWENLITGEQGVVKVRKEVVLSAGPIGSAQLLMLSGIGPEEHLKEVGVEVVRNLPVGRFLQDQLIVGLNFNPRNVIDSLDSLSFWSFLQYGLFRAGKFVRPLIEAMAFERFFPTPEENSKEDQQKQPEQQQQLPGESESQEQPEGVEEKEQDQSEGEKEKQLVVHESRTSHPTIQYIAFPRNWKRIFDPSPVHPSGMSIMSVLLHPKSTGRLELMKNSIYHVLKIDPNYLSNEQDEKILIQAAKRAKQISETESFRALHDDKFLDNVSPDGGENGQDAVHDEAFWKDYVIRNASSGGFTIGTCRMGNDESDSVVNRELKVHGIKKLRVADTGVVPTFVSSCAPRAVSMVIAEKAAALIKEEHLLF